MLLKAVAKDKKTDQMKWFYDVWTNGDTIMINTKHRGMQTLKQPIELWVSFSDELSFTCVYAKEHWLCGLSKGNK